MVYSFLFINSQIQLGITIIGPSILLRKHLKTLLCLKGKYRCGKKKKSSNLYGHGSNAIHSSLVFYHLCARCDSSRYYSPLFPICSWFVCSLLPDPHFSGLVTSTLISFSASDLLDCSLIFLDFGFVHSFSAGIPRHLVRMSHFNP